MEPWSGQRHRCRLDAPWLAAILASTVGTRRKRLRIPARALETFDRLVPFVCVLHFTPLDEEVCEWRREVQF